MTVGVRLGDSHGDVVVSHVLHFADLPPLGGVRVKLLDLCTVPGRAGVGQHSVWTEPMVGGVTNPGPAHRCNLMKKYSQHILSLRPAFCLQIQNCAVASPSWQCRLHTNMLAFSPKKMESS